MIHSLLERIVWAKPVVCGGDGDMNIVELR